MNLPKRVEAPPLSVLGPSPLYRYHWLYFVGTVRDAGIELAVDPQLKAPCWGAFEFRVDGELAGYDYSDFLPFDSVSWRYRYWFKREFCPAYRVCRHLASFSPPSFLDWNRYRKLAAGGTYTASGSTILHKQSTPAPQNPVGEDLYRRRMKAREILTRSFGSRVDTSTGPQDQFFASAFDCLVSVHIPGSWPHCLDRGQHQLMGLGVCTISPDLWTCCCEARPQPWLHYVPLLDDFSDLAERIEWCDRNRDECRQIGNRAKAFFEAHSTPEAIWRHVQQRLSA